MIYRVSYYSDQDGHGGFAYFMNRADAMKFCREQYPGVPIKLGAGSYEEYLTIETTATPRTKLGMVRLLSMWGEHPDNG
jgi:hypothetical protein